MSRLASPLRGRMIFLVGARRSGTNWLQRVLCARPDVVAIPSETYLFSHGIAPLVERFQHAAPTSPTTGSVYMEPEAMLDAIRDLCDAVFEGVRAAVAPGASRLVERTPDHVRYLSLIGDVYPDSHVVHIIRDGRDVARSLLAQEWGPRSIEDAAEEWRSAIVAARAAAPRLPHYREVRYEQLLAGPRDLFADLFSWLDLDASSDAVEGALLESGVVFNVDTGSPKIAAGKWRESLSDEDVERFMEIAGGTLVELGYDTRVGISTGQESSRPARRARTTSISNVRKRVADRRTQRTGAVQRQIISRAKEFQQAFDKFLSGLAARHFDEAAGLLSPDAYVRIVGDGQDIEARGGKGRTKLVEALAEDPALRGRIVRSDVHPSVPTLTAITSYRLTDGSVRERVIVATVSGGAITRLNYYRLPLIDGPEPSAARDET